MTNPYTTPKRSRGLAAHTEGYQPPHTDLRADDVRRDRVRAESYAERWAADPARVTFTEAKRLARRGLLGTARAKLDMALNESRDALLRSIHLTPALARRVAEESEKLSSMPEHGTEGWRPVVVVAWKGRKRPFVCARYDHRPVGTMLATDSDAVFLGYDKVQIVTAIPPKAQTLDLGNNEQIPSADPVVAVTTLIRTVYAERMTAAAIVGGDAPVRMMNSVRDCLVDLLGCSRLQAATLVRGLHVTFCDDLGHTVPADYRAGLVAAFEANCL